jgi:hypothetical protein
MATVTVAAPRTVSARRPGWARRWVSELGRTEPQPTSTLTVRWQLLSESAGIRVDTVRVRAGRVPGAWSDGATVRPAADGTVSVELRLPLEVWAAPAVLDFTVALAAPGWSHRDRTYTLTTAEPFFWNGSDAAVDIELNGHVHDDGTIEPRVTDVLVHF